MIERACVILCGGKSSRMGQNKALLSFKNQALLSYLIQKYKKIFKKVYLCCKEQNIKDYECFGAEMLIEKSEVFSPMIGLYTALEVLQKDSFIVTTDCPFLQQDHFARLEYAWENCEKKILYAKTQHKSHFLIGIYSPRVLAVLYECIQNQEFKLSFLMQKCASLGLEFDDEESFSNLNTQQDYQEALLRISDGK